MKRLLALFVLAPLALFADEGYHAKVKVTPLVTTSTDAGGQPIVYPKVESPEVRALLVEIPPGAQTGWHRHPYPCFGYMLEGELTVQIQGGKLNVVKAGDAIVEVVNLWHNGTNTGDKPAKLVMFATGEKGEPFTVRQ